MSENSLEILRLFPADDDEAERVWIFFGNHKIATIYKVNDNYDIAMYPDDDKVGNEVRIPLNEFSTAIIEAKNKLDGGNSFG